MLLGWMNPFYMNFVVKLITHHQIFDLEHEFSQLYFCCWLKFPLYTMRNLVFKHLIAFELGQFDESKENTHWPKYRMTQHNNSIIATVNMYLMLFINTALSSNVVNIIGFTFANQLSKGRGYLPFVEYNKNKFR